MRFSTFVPAVLALTLFTATQASPSMMKRDRNDLDAVVNLFVRAHTKVAVDACAKITADVCADVDITLDAKANVLGSLVTANVDVEKLRISAKAQLDVDIKAKVDADVKAIVIAPIRASVERVIIKLCPLLERECIRANAHNIVAKVNADVDVYIHKLWVALKVDLPAHIRLRAKVIVKEICVHAGIVEAAIRARVFIASNIDVHVKVWAKVWATLWAKVKLVALIRAL
ncbi:hypothetical protein BC939DRAFT_446271 [Gamsiella multidivaricata]|uniref:uncharacterized protein n=1 Tax=Gamsiella multidivaricata TaxID=101098 RepID=UPI00221F7E1B|nr:uncharacterized protein BC939DRAFT_446271 [Gamsiella multidivaricata]KAG0367115.1 hypothetical protein BGZ54_004364 [Gamsiella multidivaricata]KAI7826941.1 hypothetical protein BC939DRAFT_446271 [Gamsiella multidivaricata]